MGCVVQQGEGVRHHNICLQMPTKRGAGYSEGSSVWVFEGLLLGTAGSMCFSKNKHKCAGALHKFDGAQHV
jgi:hypothetical protein